MASVMSLVCITVLLLWLSTVHAQMFQPVTASIYGKALINHRYKDMKAQDLGDCIFKCIQDSSGKCQSTNWNLESNVCELNDEKYEDHPQDLVERWFAIYMTSIGSDPTNTNIANNADMIVNTNTTKTNTVNVAHGNAKRSCKEILDSGQSEGSGEYMIDPENTGTPFKVYCDMITDGGGWILIKNYTLTEPVQSFSSVINSSSYRDISKYNQLNHYLRMSDLYKLRILINATQLRWYCYKESHKRTLHIMTNTDKKGHYVFRHFTESAVTTRTACGSFTDLDDDNSQLSKNCQNWGKDEITGALRVNKWGWDVILNDTRIFNTVIRWESNYILGFYLDQYNCDDESMRGISSVKNGDTWMVYIR